MSKIQSIVLAVMMTVLIFMGLDGDGYIHKAALFVAGWMGGYLMLAVFMEWKGIDQ